MATVDVEVFGNLLPGAPRRQAIELTGPATVCDIAARLSIDLDTIGLVIVDGVQCDLDDPVSPGCRLCFFPPLSGG